ncbi:MAG: PEP-CTERM sorting domain-containing protein [Verrucomicrobiota bacterium]
MMRHTSKAMLCGAIVIMAMQTAHAANLVQNGSFTAYTDELGNTTPNGQLGYDIQATDWTATGTGTSSIGYSFLYQSGVTPATTTYAAGNASVAGAYNNLGQYVYLYGPGANGGAVNNGLNTAPSALTSYFENGGNFVTGSGVYPSSPPPYPSVISQTITGLTVGDAYAVSFWYAGAQQYGYTGANTEAWYVSLGGVTDETPVLNNSNEGFTGWQSETFDFVPTNATEVLAFAAYGTPSTAGPPVTLLADVSMTLGTPPSAPDTASTALLCGVSLMALLVAPRLLRQH